MVHLLCHKTGVRKVNIDTDLRMAATGAVRKFLVENPSVFDPRKYLQASTDAMYGICKSRYEAFSNASKIRAISLEDMTDQYASGALDQVIR